MRILVNTCNYFEYLTSFLTQGLTKLGHECFCIRRSDNSYLKPWDDGKFDLYMDTFPTYDPPPHFVVNSGVPKVMVWTYDLDDGPQPFHPDKFPWFDIYFIRELKEKYRDNVYPMNYAIDDRYYCITETFDPPLKDREFNLTFFGSYGGGNSLMGIRASKLKDIEEKTKEWNPIIGKQWTYEAEPDNYWSKIVRGRFHHDLGYFNSLVKSKIIISPHGGGVECGRHYEALGAHSIPLIEKFNCLSIEPTWETNFPEIVWTSTSECADKCHYYLNNIEEAQLLADNLFEFGKNNLRTIHRGQYFLDRLKDHKLI